jgi:hypothetical protein
MKTTRVLCVQQTLNAHTSNILELCKSIYLELMFAHYGNLVLC